MKTNDRKSLFATIAIILFGLVVATLGGRLVVYQNLLESNSERVTGTITKASYMHRASGGNVSYIHYRFQDQAGDYHKGKSSGYSGAKGEPILLEYVPAYPFIHRVSGEKRHRGYRWRWAITGAGLFFMFAGIYSLLRRN